ncbi:MAG: cardiolipin synthase [Clostridiales bacterium]|nr:cardiolipin synthase [Clostridiales bacterium]
MGKIKKIKVRSKVFSRDASLVRIKTERNNLGVIKTVILALLIVLQLALALYLYYSYAYVFNWVVIVSFALSVITCIYVLSTEKSGQSKAVWIMFILLFSSVGFIFYILSDERFFFGRHKKRYKEIFERTEKYKAPCADLSSRKYEVKNDLIYLKTVGNFPAYNDCALKYFPSGASLFDDVLLKLKSAKKFIFMEFFIVADGVLLTRTLDILKAKVAEGVDVRLLYDDMGSHRTLLNKTVKEMKEAGIKVQSFNRLIPRFNVALNYRDHRKIIVIDGKVAYTGGVNLADEYINEKRMYGYWKDIGVKIEGSAVDGICHIFLRQWEFVSKKEEDYSIYLNNYTPCKNNSIVAPYADGLDYSQPIGKSVYINQISGAKAKIYIMTPYFVPDDVIIGLLAAKAQSGVDVRLVLPDVPDKPYVYRLSRNYAEKLIDSGVRVFCMKSSFVHAKCLLTDNCVTVSSINVDFRSFYQQFECGIYTDEPTFMKEVEKDFVQTFIDSEEITLLNRKRKSLINRILSGLLQFFAPLM